MTDASPRWRRVEELCHAALEREGRDRAAFLASACSGDETLRREVEALLAHAQSAEGFLAEPVDAIAAGVLGESEARRAGPSGSTGDLIGRRLGPYAIVARLGAGGMGEVYRARDAKLGRDVAIKVLPPLFTAVTFSKDEVWSDLWQIDLDRGVPTRLTFHPDDDFWPSAWSPDGQRVVFSSSRTRKGIWDLYQRSAAGSATDELLWQSGETKSASGFSPDGKILLVNRYMNRGQASDLWALPMTGDRKPFPLIETPFNENGAVFSPDGRYIAYVSELRLQSGVCAAIPADGGAGAALDRKRVVAGVDRGRPDGSVCDVGSALHGGGRDDLGVDRARRISSNALQGTKPWRRHQQLCRRPVRPALSAGRARPEDVLSNHRGLELAVAVGKEMTPDRGSRSQVHAL